MENKLTEQRIELDCTKEQLEFIRSEAEKNKELVERTGEHGKKLNDMQKLLERTTADHATIQSKMFCLAKIVASYQKMYGSINVSNIPTVQNVPVVDAQLLFNELDSDDLESNISVANEKNC